MESTGTCHLQTTCHASEPVAAPDEAVDKVCVTFPLKKFMLNSGTIISTKVVYRTTLLASMYMPVP